LAGQSNSPTNPPKLLCSNSSPTSTRIGKRNYRFSSWFVFSFDLLFCAQKEMANILTAPSGLSPDQVCIAPDTHETQIVEQKVLMDLRLRNIRRFGIVVEPFGSQREFFTSHRMCTCGTQLSNRCGETQENCVKNSGSNSIGAGSASWRLG
jgi:hypothetical protein